MESGDGETSARRCRRVIAENSYKQFYVKIIYDPLFSVGFTKFLIELSCYHCEDDFQSLNMHLSAITSASASNKLQRIF